MVAVRLVAVWAEGISVVAAPLIVNFTTELAVHPLPLTVKGVMLADPAFAENGEMEAMLNAPAPPRFRSQTPRPLVAARRVRDGLCSVRPRICALGKEEAAPKGDQLSPP